MGMLGNVSDAVGGVASAYAAWKGQHEANKMNVHLARDQMAFQERMSGTAYQRAKADMVKAGINPIIGLSGSGGASSPPGAAPTMQSETAGASASALSALRARKEIQAIEAGTAKLNAERRGQEIKNTKEGSTLGRYGVEKRVLDGAAGLAHVTMDQVGSSAKHVAASHHFKKISKRKLPHLSAAIARLKQ